MSIYNMYICHIYIYAYYFLGKYMRICREEHPKMTLFQSGDSLCFSARIAADLAELVGKTGYYQPWLGHI
jgi:hypothetical protein